MKHELDSVWDAIEAALDARSDPLEDARVARFLAEHPSAAREYAELVLGLERVERARMGTSRAPSRRSRSALTVAACAVMLAVVALGFHFLRGGKPEPTGVARVPSEPSVPVSVDAAPNPVADSSRFGVTHYRFERELVTHAHRERVVVENGTVARTSSRTSVEEALAVTIERTRWGANALEFR